MAKQHKNKAAAPTTAPTGMHRGKIRLVLIIAVLLCYTNTLFNGYALDDEASSSQKNYVEKGISGIPGIVTHLHYSNGVDSYDYRPVSLITLAIENQFFGKSPGVSHFINMLLYIVLALVVYKVLVEVFSLQKLHPLIPLIISLFYIVHPAHTEVVASIKNREELLSVLFALLALLYAHRYYTAQNSNAVKALLCMLFLLLSLASKISSLPIVGVIVLAGIYQGFYKNKKQYLLLTLPMLAFSGAYFYVLYRLSVRDIYFVENPLVFSHTLSTRLGMVSQTLLYYFKFMFYPYPLRFYYGYDTITITTMANGAAIASMLLHIALAVYGCYAMYKKQLLGLLILSYFACIFLYSNLPVLYTGIVAERALFLPGLWFIAFVVIGVYNIYKGVGPKVTTNFVNKAAWVFLGLWLIAYAGLTVKRNFEWKDSFTLMKADMPNLKKSVLANFIYASENGLAAEKTTDAALRKKYCTEAIKYFKRSGNIKPNYPRACYQAGMLLEYENQEFDSAFVYFNKAYINDTTFFDAQFQLAKLYYLKNNLPEANRLFGSLYSKNPADTFTLYFYAQVLVQTGKPNQAIAIANKLISLAPAKNYGYMTLGVVYERMGDIEKAVPNLEKGTLLGGRDTYVYNLLTKYYMAHGQIDKFSAMQKLYGTGQLLNTP